MYLWNVGICGVRWRSVIGATFDRVREERGICINWRCTDEQPGGRNELCLQFSTKLVSRHTHPSYEMLTAVKPTLTLCPMLMYSLFISFENCKCREVERNEDLDAEFQI